MALTGCYLARVSECVGSTGWFLPHLDSFSRRPLRESHMLQPFEDAHNSVVGEALYVD